MATKYALCHKRQNKPRDERFDTAAEAFAFIHPSNRDQWDIVRVEVKETYFKQVQQIAWIDAV